MVSRVIPLEDTTSVTDIGAMIGPTLSQIGTNIDNISFGSELQWRRHNLYKLVEYLDSGTTVEHVCALHTDKNRVVPYLSKYYTKNLAQVFTQVYVAGILEHQKYTNYQVYSMADMVMQIVLKQLSPGYPKLIHYLRQWIDRNPDLRYIAPTYTFFNNKESSINLYDVYMDPLKYGGPIPSMSPTYIGDAQHHYNHGWIASPVDLEIIASMLVSLLIDAYDQVCAGMENEALLTDILIDSFTPWKRYTYIDPRVPLVHLGSMLSFIAGEMTISTLQTHIFADAYNILPAMDPRYVRTPLVDTLDIPVHTCTPENTKEFSALIEYIQSINLTDISLRFDVQKLSRGVFTPEIVHYYNRYQPDMVLPPSIVPGILIQYPNNVLLNSFYERFTRLGECIVNWLLVSSLNCFDTNYLYLDKNFNEYLTISFETSMGYKDTVFRCDLLAGSMCSRCVCNVDLNYLE